MTLPSQGQCAGCGFSLQRQAIPSLSADISPDGKAKEWPLYDPENRQVIVLDEDNIHPAKESEVKMVDWDRTYFLTKYYML